MYLAFYQEIMINGLGLTVSNDGLIDLGIIYADWCIIIDGSGSSLLTVWMYFPVRRLGFARFLFTIIKICNFDATRFLEWYNLGIFHNSYRQVNILMLIQNACTDKRLKL